MLVGLISAFHAGRDDEGRLPSPVWKHGILIPGLGLDEQLYYITPKIGLVASEKAFIYRF